MGGFAMNHYREEYNRKLMSVDEALSHIKTGDVIGTSQCGVDPVSTMRRLHTITPKVTDLTMMCGMSVEEYPFLVDPAYAEHFHLDGIFFTAASRTAYKNHRLSYYPASLHNGAGRWVDTHHPNVFIGQATPMDEHGYFCISLCLIHEKEFFDSADLVILEVNPKLPRIFGDTEVHISDVDCIVEVDNDIARIPYCKPSEKDMQIGQYIASLVNDGDTIQLGIGSIPDAAAASLMDKHDLGVHTEMFTNSMVDLVEAGVITGKKKTLHRGKMVGVFAYGEQRLYDMLDNNPSVMMMRGSYVNRPSVLAQNDNMVSVNTTLAIDLTAQCCSETIGSRQYSGSGGASDTCIGAIHSKGGRSIVAVHSTAKHGTVSSITAQLPSGSAVTLNRNDVDYIVTEYGIAPIRGRSVRERVNNLIAVAHPDFRAELRRDAEKYMLW
jgi:acyl-CoA hydrolase